MIAAFFLKFLSPEMFKYIAYIVVALVIFIILWVLYSTIKENGEKDIIIETQTGVIETQKLTITRMELINDLKDQHIAIRDAEAKNLEDKLDNITNNLGDDSLSSAPESLKELFRRLNK